MSARLPRTTDPRRRPIVQTARLAIWITVGSVVVVACGRPAPPTAAATQASPPTREVTNQATPYPWILIADGTAPDIADAVAGWAADTGVDARLVASDPEGIDPGGLMAAVGSEAALGRVAESWSRLGVFLVVLEPAAASPGPTLSTIGPETRLDQAGFLAGLAAGHATTFGGVGLVGGDDGSAFASGFDEGVRYACPRCRREPIPDSGAVPLGIDVVGYPPGYDVPVAPPGPGEVWVVLAGSAMPAWADRVAARVVTAPETLVLAALEALTLGQAGQAWAFNAENGGLRIADVNPEAISPGRERLVRDSELGLRLGQLVVGGGG